MDRAPRSSSFDSRAFARCGSTPSLSSFKDTRPCVEQWLMGRTAVRSPLSRHLYVRQIGSTRHCTSCDNAPFVELVTSVRERRGGGSDNREHVFRQSGSHHSRSRAFLLSRTTQHISRSAVVVQLKIRPVWSGYSSHDRGATQISTRPFGHTYGRAAGALARTV